MKPKLSQHFLIRPEIAEKIVAALDLAPEDPVLEIGPGRGILTAALLKAGARVTAVEIDDGLSDALEERWKKESRFRLIRSDFLNILFDQITMSPGKKMKVIGNLPYAVTSPILQKVLQWRRWSRAIFMVQKEVAERLAAKPGKKDYGVLTVSVQSRCAVEKVLDVSRGAFKPPPRVDSTVVRVTPLPQPLFEAQEEIPFFRTVKAAFAHRRKMAANSLAEGLGISTQQIRGALLACNLPGTARAEVFSVQDFVRLSRTLMDTGLRL